MENDYEMTEARVIEIQFFLQMYDRGLVSKKTMLNKFGINWDEEKKEIEKDIEFDKKRCSQSMGDNGGTQ